MSMDGKDTRGGVSTKSPADCFVTFNMRDGKTFVSFRDTGGKQEVQSISGFIVDDLFQSVGGGQQGVCFIDSNKGYNFKVGFNVYRRVDRNKESERIASGPWNVIKPGIADQHRAKIVWHPMGYLTEINGKVVAKEDGSPFIFEMTVHGSNNREYMDRARAIGRTSGSGCKFSISEFVTITNKRYGSTSRVPAWEFIYCGGQDGVHKKLWDTGMALQNGPIGDYREALLVKGAATVENASDATRSNDWGEDLPSTTSQPPSTPFDEKVPDWVK